MGNKFIIEVRFSKNRHYPQYGPKAYNIESYSVKIPYGKKFKFKSSKKAIEYVENKILPIGLDALRFNSISIINWRGFSGTSRYIKNDHETNDSNPIDIEYIENLFKSYK